jgi:hypothetical protein
MQDYDVILFIIALAKTMTPQWEPTATAVAAWPAKVNKPLF